MGRSVICRPSKTCDSSQIIFVDCSHPVAGPRIRDIILRDLVPEDIPQGDEALEGFHHFIAPTLPHLLALLIHPSPSFPPPKASLIVVDAVSSLFNLAFPKVVNNTGNKQSSCKPNDVTQWAASRRWAVMGDFISKLGKLAATKNIAILLTMQTATRVYAESEMCLYPAIAGTAWDNGINARIVLFRDWLFKSAASSSPGEYEQGARYAAVVKAGGISYEGFSKAVPFNITKVVLSQIV